MCDKCANIDYPIGDVIWLPCGGQSWRYNNPHYRHTPMQPRDDSKDIELLAQIFSGLRRPENQPPTKPFEGAE